MSNFDKKCVIIFDEMSIKRYLDYNTKDDIIYGFSDFGDLGRSSTIATHVLSFSLRGLNRNWKQTISFYVGTATGIQIAEILKDTISKISGIGFRVLAVCCDQGSNNRNAYRLLGATEAIPYKLTGNSKVCKQQQP